jgi:hypothetical protein
MQIIFFSIIYIVHDPHGVVQATQVFEDKVNPDIHDVHINPF